MMAPIAVVLSILGLAPFVVFGLGALGSDTGTAARMLGALIDYAALVLAFVGGAHWGFALAEPDVPRSIDGTTVTARAGWKRFTFGAAGLVIGWIALILSLMLAFWVALVVLILGYIAAIVVEHHRRVWLPPRWLWLRWGFTAVAVAMLTTVLTLRLLGQTVVF
jgi:hypothetical protein